MSTGATPIDDPNVKLPKALRATADKADQLHKQIYNAPAGDTAPAVVPPAVVPPADAPPTPPPADVTPPPADTTPPAPAAEPQGGWEHAYRSMKGRYDNMRDANRALADRVASLESDIAALQATPVTPVAPPPAPAESLLTEQEINDYGPEFIAVIGKKAKEIAAAETAALRQELDSLKQQVGNTSKTIAKSDREKMKEQLAQAVPNWQAINTNADFLAWLALPDEMSGAIRHTLLKDAWGRNQAARVTAIFKSFIAQEAAGVPTEDTQPSPPPDNTGKVPLETLAAPGRPKPAADPRTPADKQTSFTRAEIAQFHTEVASGRWRGRDEERLAKDAAIFAAIKAGRVTQ